MKIAGDLAEFALADLIQVQGLSGRTCAIRVLAPEASGALHLVDGRPVHAVFEDLTGEDAFIALVAARSGYFQIDAAATTAERTLHGELRDMLLDAAARIDDGTVPAPARPRPARMAAPGPASGAGAAAATPPAPAPAAGRGRVLALGALALLGALVVAGFAFSRLDAAHGGDVAATGSTAGATAAPLAANAVEATALAGPRDALPALLAGAPPAAPAGAALRPTIVCRLLVDPAGRVAEAKVYRSRLDLAAFEESALDAVGRYRFAPGRRDGRPVAVWINWPVSFR